MFRLLDRWRTGAAALCLVAGLAVLLGGGLRAGSLMAMTPSTAAVFTLAGGALWITGRRPPSFWLRLLADGTATMAGLIAASALPGRMMEPVPAARMAPLTAVCFLMLALALLSLDRKRIFIVGQRLAVASGFVALFGVATWAFHAGASEPLEPTDMAIGTALLLAGLSVGVIAARPGRGATAIFAEDTAGGMVARWVLPSTLLGSLLIGGLGLAGERAGLYDREASAALATVVSLSLFSTLVWIIAVRLHRTDVRRLAAEQELRRTNADLEARVEARTHALAQSEARYRHLIENSPEGIVIHQDGVVRFINPAALRIFGTSDSSGVIGRPILDYIAPDHRDSVMARVAARLRGEAVASFVEVEALRPDGTRFWMAVAATVVDWEGGRANLVSLLDISEQRRRQAAEREAESLRAVTRLANAAAHEINNPLTVVGGNVHLLAARLPDRPDLQRYIDRALRGVATIAEMITHMTRITRLAPLEHLDTAGVPILDLRGSSGQADPGPGTPPGPAADPAPAPIPAPGAGPGKPPGSL